MLSTLFMEGGGPEFRLDLLCPIVYDVCPGLGNILHLCCAHDGCIIDHGQHQYHCHHSEYACSGHDIDEDATVCVDLADNRVLTDRGYASACRCGHHDVV